MYLRIAYLILLAFKPLLIGRPRSSFPLTLGSTNPTRQPTIRSSHSRCQSTVNQLPGSGTSRRVELPTLFFFFSFLPTPPFFPFGSPSGTDLTIADPELSDC
ncbi:hypothetical protein LY78DRAFT_366150 [Colletotrichum sublineola]|nr:hypothetical protein LY78DRAFT_366150 [Colletotrichum sublineola]